MPSASPDADPATGLPIGPPVDASPATRPGREALHGRFASVVPLDAGAHADALHAASHGPGAEALWLYLPQGPFPDRAAFRAWIEACEASADPLFFAFLDPAGAPVGMGSYLRVEPTHRAIEVGHLLFTPLMQRAPAATEAMALMAGRAFDLGYRRYEWKCNALNAPSRRAAERLGFTYEGTFRQDRIVKGRSRDTAWFSMLDHEWPTRRAAFAAWLDPGNFDAEGRQRRRLEDLRAG